MNRTTACLEGMFSHSFVVYFYNQSTVSVATWVFSLFLFKKQFFFFRHVRIASFERGYRFSDLLSNKEIHILLNALSKIRTVLHDGRLVQEYGGNHNQRPRVLHHRSRNALDFTVHGIYVKRLSESDRSSTCPRQASENGSFGWRRCPRSAAG